MDELSKVKKKHDIPFFSFLPRYKEVQSKLPGPPEFLQTTFIHPLVFLRMKVG